MIRHVLHKIKDCTVSCTSKVVANYKFKRYGKMIDFKIDSEHKTISLSLLPKGEDKAIEILVRKYTIEKREERYFLTVKQVEFSREWIQTLFEEFVKGQEFEIPAKMAKVAGLLL